MKLYAPDIPDDPAELPGWLERHLTGLDLAALVSELEAVHGPGPEGAATLDRVLGDRRGEVLDRGLAALPPDRLRHLLRRPRLLLELQDLVLSSGGDHWRRAGAPSPDLDAWVALGRMRLEGFLADEGRGLSRREVLPSSRPLAWYRRPAVVGLATAASVLTAVILYERVRPRGASMIASAPAGWGWSNPGALPQGLPPAAYLDRLADAAEAWFQERPDDALALARRIGEFRQGCSVLILAEHRALAAEDRAWLVERCRAWAARFDAHLAAVEAGRDPGTVRAEADATVRALIEALRARTRDLA